MTTRLLYALALACAAVTTACSDEFGPIEPISAPPAFSRQAEDLNLADGLTLLEGLLNGEVKMASGVIGPEGGTVTVWTEQAGSRIPHTLSVPAGAVRVPTYFGMMLSAGTVIEVDLVAIEVGSGNQITRFKKPLSLSLSFAGAAVEDPYRLRIVHVVDKKIVEVVSSTVDADRRVVIGQVSHFSRYAVASR